MSDDTPAAPPRRRIRHRHCRVCGVRGTEDNRISSRGKCAPCGESALAEAIRSLHSKQGDVYESWRVGLLQAMLVATGVAVLPANRTDSSTDCSDTLADVRMIG